MWGRSLTLLQWQVEVDVFFFCVCVCVAFKYKSLNHAFKEQLNDLVKAQDM